MVYCWWTWVHFNNFRVMIDELSQGLAAFNENIIVISPYYHKNKKGQTGYLQEDKITHLLNFKIFVGSEEVEIGVFYGIVNKVNLYFIHNEIIFPTPYPDGLFILI